jgi:hypothetical protein
MLRPIQINNGIKNFTANQAFPSGKIGIARSLQILKFFNKHFAFTSMTLHILTL